MGETGVVLILLFVLTAGCWFLVLSRRTRDRVQRPAWSLYKLNEEQRDMWNAIYFAGVLVVALTFTILFAVSVVLAIRA